MMLRRLDKSVIAARRRDGSAAVSSKRLSALLNIILCGAKWPNEKAEPPPTRDVNRDSGTDSANGGWLRRLVRHHFVGAGSSKYSFPSFSPTGYVPSLNRPPGANVIFSCLTTERFERYETPSVSFHTRSGSSGSGFVSLMSVAVCATSLAYCFLPLSLNLTGTLSQQVSAIRALASCFSKACLAAATNRASSSGDAARTGCNRKTNIAVRANINVFISVVCLVV